MSSFFSKIKSGISDLFGLGKTSSSNQGFFNKAKSLLTSGVDLLRNKNVQKGVDFISNLTGNSSIKDFFLDAKKYGNMGQNLLNGGLNKKIDRSGLPNMVDRFADRFKKRDSTMELQPRRQRDEPAYNLSSIFG